MKLYVFDFDGTLYRSGPMPPPGEEEGAWFSSLKSLSPPWMAEVPGPEHWIPKTCEFLRSLVPRYEENFLVLQTGREAWFENRIKALLDQQELEVDHINCRPPGYPIDQFKLWCLGHYINILKDLEEIIIFDDQKPLLTQYVKFCSQYVPTRGFLVVAHSYPFETPKK